MRVTTVRLRPPEPKPVVLGDYELDAVALEFDEDGRFYDFRFELGRGFDIYYALPRSPDQRLRLFHVDSAVYELEDIALVSDQCAIDLPLLEWRGELARVGATSELEVEHVSVVASATPVSYRCQVRTREGGGVIHTVARAFP